MADGEIPTQKTKGIYIGAPACFALELACSHLVKAFLGPGNSGCYVVGSALERPDWRDIDVRFMLDDDEFAALFPNAKPHGHWEADPRWLLLTVMISKWLSDQTGLPIDFQFQPTSHGNEKHKKRRNSVGMRYA